MLRLCAVFSWQAVLLWLSTALLVDAHGYVSDIWIDGTRWEGYNPYIDGTIRNVARIAYPIVDNWPQYDPMSSNITCSYNKTPNRPYLVAPAQAGANMTIRWTRWPDSHFGPMMTYLAWCGGPCRDFDVHSEKARFFKIAHDGWRQDKKNWFSDDFIKNNSTFSLTLPKNIPNGEYLVRTELLSLHAVGSGEYGPEFYPSCFQISVSGGTGSVVPEGVEFPGAYTLSDAGINFDAKKPFTSYPIPGPAIAVV